MRPDGLEGCDGSAKQNELGDGPDPHVSGRDCRAGTASGPFGTGEGATRKSRRVPGHLPAPEQPAGVFLDEHLDARLRGGYGRRDLRACDLRRGYSHE
eukprot:scaffold7500_cov127-Isochrysis_galbana.AAC.10